MIGMAWALWQEGSTCRRHSGQGVVWVIWGTVLHWAILHCKLLVNAGHCPWNLLCASESPENVVFRFFSRLSSCYGTVSSLNGEPEQGVAVEAVGQSDCSIYGEDTVTDEEGKFRLRGLLVSLWMCFISGFFHTGFSGVWVQWCPQDC